MAPRFSIVTPVHDPPADVLRAMLRSVQDQTFGDWQLCVVDDASPAAHVREILAAAAAEDPRITVVRRPDTGGMARASNDALAIAQGEFVVLLDHEDELHADALQVIDDALQGAPSTDYLYTDEDAIDEGGRRGSPFFKPDWSPERLRTQLYTCHVSVLRRSLVTEVGGFRPELEGSQLWDLVLRVTERARGVVHVPNVLYHRRVEDSAAAPDVPTGGSDADATSDAGAAAVDVLEDHCRRVGFPATVECDVEHGGVFHLRPALADHPRVSVVIPTNGARREIRGHDTSLVVHCVRSIVSVSTYPDYEIVVVADDSTPPAVVDELVDIGGARVRVVPYALPFNFSDKINTGALASDGEHLLMLNDDMEVVTPGWLERLVMYSSFPGVGAVGAKLLFGDGRLQHVGVVVRGTSPGHLYRGFAGDHDGYANVVRVANNYTAVTGACLMTPRALFDELGGLSTSFPLSFNDVDYCLKVRAAGRRVVYDPDTVLYHFESSSRSPDVSPWELELLRSRWRYATLHDPYDNPNFHPNTVNMLPPVYHHDGEVLV